MPRSDLLGTVAATVADYAREALGREVAVDEETQLAGRDGLFDSMGLVTVVLEVEQRLNDRAGITLSLVDDRAMSQSRSPFRSVGSLVDYVAGLLDERAAR